MTNQLPLARITRDQARDLHSHTRKGTVPVIVEASVPDWGAPEIWTLDSLRSLIGHHSVPINIGYFDQTNAQRHRISDILDAIGAGAGLAEHAKPYIMNIDVYHELPELIPYLTPRLEFAGPNWLQLKILPQFVPDGLVELFVGGAGSGFPKLHQDTHASHAFITQLSGRKNVILIPPTETSALADAFGDPERCTLDGLEDNHSIAVCRHQLEPGQTLFIPALWWHTTFHTEFSVSVSTNIVDSSNWHRFVQYATRKDTAVKAALKKLVYSSAGVIMLVADRMKWTFPYR